MKTTSTGSPKVKKVTSTQPKKRGRPVGSKKSTGGEHSYLTPGSINASKFSLSVGNAPVKTWERGPETGEQTGSKTKKVKEGWEKEWDKFNTIKLRSNELPDSEATVEQVKDWSRFKPQGEVECNYKITGNKLLCFCDDCINDEPVAMSLPNKITLVLTVVNVAILISLVIKNV